MGRMPLSGLSRGVSREAQSDRGRRFWRTSTGYGTGDLGSKSGSTQAWRAPRLADRLFRSRKGQTRHKSNQRCEALLLRLIAMQRLLLNFYGINRQISSRRNLLAVLITRRDACHRELRRLRPGTACRRGQKAFPLTPDTWEAKNGAFLGSLINRESICIQLLRRGLCIGCARRTAMR